MRPGYGKEEFGKQFDVSRETLERLDRFHIVLEKWNARINLVSAATLPQLWERHIADSAQLWALGRTEGLWVDLGAGAGFPGLVLAAIAASHPVRFTLVESDSRKAVFLSEAARVMDLDVRVITSRIEATPPLNASVLSARALSPLAKLLEYTEKHRLPHGIALFPKGRTVHKEIEEATRRWRFDSRIHRSGIEPGAAIVEVGALARA